MISWIVHAILIHVLISVIHCWSPTNNYAPGRITCPSQNVPIVRTADHLLEEEISYVRNRYRAIKPYLADFLERANLDFDFTDFIESSTINIGLAFSGGGYRAMLGGAGVWDAIDSRSENSDVPGHLGGLLQSSMYISALSGGSWLLGSVYLNNFTTVEALRRSHSVWNLQQSLFHESYSDLGQMFKWYANIFKDVSDKQEAGFAVSVTDLWGRALARQLIDLKNGGPALQWSDMTEWPWFCNYQVPYPIILANARNPFTEIVDPLSPIIEITPYELGSFDLSLNSFSSLKYLGTSLHNGRSPDCHCYTGFDNAGFILGTSSSVFDMSAYKLIQMIPGKLGHFLQSFLEPLIKRFTLDVSLFKPNPFRAFSGALSDDNVDFFHSDTLYLVDGGQNEQVVPLQPLIHVDRNIDVIFAFDFDTDTDSGWPNGHSLVKTYQRQFAVDNYRENLMSFPHVPDDNTFINLGLTATPTFFGCSSLNETRTGRPAPPLLVYLSNYPYTYWANTSTFKLVYTAEEMDGIISNGYSMMTQLNGTLDKHWHTCIACAIVHRETERRSMIPSKVCQQCLDRYCWNGSLEPKYDGNSPYLNPALMMEK